MIGTPLWKKKLEGVGFSKEQATAIVEVCEAMVDESKTKDLKKWVLKENKFSSGPVKSKRKA